MKRSVSLLGILCLFVSFSVQAQYTNIQTWGQKLYYNGSDYPGTFLKLKVAVANPRIIRKTKCFDFWERNVLFPKTKRSFFRTPKHPLPCPFPLNFSLLIITKKFGNLAKNRYICIV